MGLWYAPLYIKAGYNVLLYDSRASGESGGNSVSWGFYEKNEWIGCSPDGRIGNNGGVEFKSRDPHIYFEYIESGKLPNVNMWQVYGQLWVTGWDWIDYMPYCHPKLKTLIIRVTPDKEKFDLLEKKLNECIEIVKRKINNFKL